MINWDGSAGTLNWLDAQNWVGGQVPGGGDQAVIGAAFAGQTIQVEGNAGVAQLTSAAPLEIASGGFNLGNGTSSIGQALTVAKGATLNLNTTTLGGTGEVLNQGTLVPYHTTFNTPVENSGLLDIESPNSVTINGSLTTTAGSLIRLQVDDGFEGAYLTVANGFTNYGTIDLVGIIFGYATLTVSEGVLVNAPSGTIDSVSSDGFRTLNAAVDNQGLITLGSSLTIADPGQTFTNSGTIRTTDGSLTVTQSGASTRFLNSGTVDLAAGGLSLNQTGSDPRLVNTGVISVESGNTLSLSSGTLEVDGSGSVLTQPGGTIALADSLTGTTTDAGQFAPVGWTNVTGGTSTAPVTLEAMSQDLGAVQGGFTGNFAYGTLTIQSGYVQLVDQSHNSAGTGAEALYVDTLIVPSGATLNLNGLKVYARVTQINGTVTGGTVGIVPGGGPIALGDPTSGTIASANGSQSWTFYGRAGQAVTVVANPGSGSAPPANPTIQYVGVQLLNPTGAVLASGNGTSAGNTVQLSNVVLPSDGVYTVRVQAATAQPASVGNYQLTVTNVTVNQQDLTLDQVYTGSLTDPLAIDRWTFAANANQQVQFDLVNSSSSAVQFRLLGPNGWTGFSGLTGSSGLVTLPSQGTYSLEAYSTSSGTGSFAFEMNGVTQTPLTLGQTYSGQTPADGYPQLFALNVPTAGQALSIHLNDPSSSDQNELYARFGTPPTREDYDYGANGSGASQSLTIPGAAAGTWYILVYADSVAKPPGNFTLVANDTPIQVTSVSPTETVAYPIAEISPVGGYPPVTLTINGAGFLPGSTVTLVASNKTGYAAKSVTFDTFTQLTATIDTVPMPVGTYSIQVSNPGGMSTTLPSSFTILATGSGGLQTRLILPAAVGRHISSTFYVQYSNTSDSPMPAPLLLLESSVADDLPLFTLDKSLVVSGFWTSGVPQGYSNTVEILASGSQVPGYLEPGESVTVPVYYAGMEQPWNLSETQFKFDIRVFTPYDQDPANWPTLASDFQPAGIPTSAWGTIYDTLASQLTGYGTTTISDSKGGITEVGDWGDYVQLLDAEASYLGQLGEDVTDVNQLWGFAVQQADNALSPVGPSLSSATDDSVTIPGTLSLSFSRVFATSIDGRDTMGPLGLGWSTPWQTTASVDSTSGAVTITGAGGAQRVFEPDTRTAGAYFSQPGDTGTLTADGHGGYLLTEGDGTATDYNANGSLNYLEDTDGNKITAGYTGGKLTSLTASSGASLTIAYNAAGLISKVTDSQGRAVTYTYDTSNQHLIAVQGYNGQTTSYTYNTSSSSPALNALTSITFPGSTHQYFAYDSTGRLSGTSNDGGAQSQSYAYALGEVTSTDGTGDTSHLYYNEQGLVVKQVDPLGNVTLNTYDSNFNLVKVTNAVGQSELYTYNAAGEVTASTDFLGNRTVFTYAGPDNELATMTDANGNLTQYSYDGTGDLINTTYANGTSETFTYDPEGDATSFLNANGQPIQYTYNSAGQVATETFSDGSAFTYTYDAHGNMATATDATGTTTFTYDPTTELLTEVAYPGGLSLTFSYNAAGQRTKMVEQTGFTTNYTYDTVGRLTELTDGSGNPIVTYTYDADGRLSKKVNGNGTYTTYQYDANGNILHLINDAPGGTVNSRFDYTYNSLGLETTEATLDGTWTYTYDADGQLVHAVFASSSPNVPSQDLAYTYDAMGNRITTVINGVTTAYTTNDVNEYTSVGGVTYQYDADGNLNSDGTNRYTYNTLNQLIGVIEAGGTTSYTYNALGQQIASTTNRQTTLNLIDPSGLGNVVGQYNNSVNSIANYSYGLGLTSQVTAGRTYYYDFDALGSTVGLSNAAGLQMDKYSYLPFGGSQSSSEAVGNPFQFVGEFGVTNQTTQISDMRARFYDVSTGRFVTRDSLSINYLQTPTYIYSNNIPNSFIDPSGLAFASPLPIIMFLGGRMSLPVAVVSTFAIPFITTVGPYIYHGLGSIFGATDTAPPELDEIPPSPANYLPPLPPGAPPYPDGAPPVYKPSAPGTLADPPTNPNPQDDGDDGDFGDDGGDYDDDSEDPNSMLGPSGYGSSHFVDDAGTSLPYQIDFENSPSATAPAQAVKITDQLDPNLDWSTFQLTGIQWGDTILTIPAGSQHFEATVPMTYNGQTFDVNVVAGIHTDTGQVYATFQSIDPTTQLPPDVLIGFLPQENSTGRGMGSVSYIIQPRAGLATGTQIRNVALITFDQNNAIATDQKVETDPSQGVDPTKQALVTIDAGAPTSSVSALPANETARTFNVSWYGSDNTGGSGVGSYTIYVSNDGGAFTPWLTDTSATSATYDGQPGHTYAFYSVATDNVGNVQATPTKAQATTTVNVAASSETSDFNGDGVSDLAVFRPKTDQWIIQYSNGGGTSILQFGDPKAGDIPAPGDYDGIGKTELAVFRPSTDQWLVAGPKGLEIFQFGDPKAGDVPAPGDYDGIGKTELAVFRPSTDQWLVAGPKGLEIFQFGDPKAGDMPVPGDYDGIGKSELAVFRSSTDQWLVAGPKGLEIFQFGDPKAGDVASPGSYDGTGKTDLAVFRPSTDQWLIAYPTGLKIFQFGDPASDDISVETPYQTKLKLEGQSAQTASIRALALTSRSTTVTMPTVNATSLVALVPEPQTDPITSILDSIETPRRQRQKAWLTAIDDLTTELVNLPGA